MNRYEVTFLCLEKDAKPNVRPWREYSQVFANSEAEAIEKATHAMGYADCDYFTAKAISVKKILG